MKRNVIFGLMHRSVMRRSASVTALFLAGVVVAAMAAGGDEVSQASVIVAVSAGGEEKYTEKFAEWAASWQKAAATAEARIVTIGLGESAPDDRSRLHAALMAERKDGPNILWLVLLGHGTAAAKDAKFNLRGDDVSVSDLGEWLKPFTRPVILVCGFSSSGAWLKQLAANERVIVTATKSGSENNFSRFGGYFSTAIGGQGADLDKDGETSVLEAWLTASRKTEDFYSEEGRIATEHSLLEDNGDGLGTPPNRFSGTRPVKRAKDGTLPDGLRAAQMHLIHSAAERALTSAQHMERDALERELAALRDKKSTTEPDAYFRELEPILLKLARIYGK